MALRTSSKDRIDMDGLKRTMEQAIEPASQVEQKSDRDIVSDLSDVVYLGFTSFLLNHDDYLKLKLSKVENEPQKSIDKTTKKLNDKMADF